MNKFCQNDLRLNESGNDAGNSDIHHEEVL